MEEAKLLQLIAQGENEEVDFKRKLDLSSARDKSEFIKDVIAIANSASEVGYLLVGVEDDKILVGTNELVEEQIQQIVHAYVDPGPVIACKMISVSSAGFVEIGVVEIKGTEKPHRVVRAIDRLNKNDVFVRHGTTTATASPEEMFKMHEGESGIQREIRQYIRAAKRHLELGNVDQAVRAYTKAIEIMPTSELFIARGKAYTKHLNPGMQSCLDTKTAALAIKDFSDSLAVADSSETEKEARRERLRIYSLCDVSILSDEYNVGENIVHDIWDKNDTEDGVWLKANTEETELGEILYLEEKVGYMYSWFSKSFEYWPRGETIPALDKAIELDYAEAEVYYLRAVAYWTHSNFGLALQDMNMAIEKNKDDSLMSDCLCGRASLLLSIGAYERAYEDLLKARGLSGSELNLWASENIHSITKELFYRFGIAQEFNALMQDDIGIYRQILQLLTLKAGRQLTVVRLSDGTQINVPRIGVGEEYPPIADAIRKIVGKEVWRAANADDPFTFIVDF